MLCVSFVERSISSARRLSQFSRECAVAIGSEFGLPYARRSVDHVARTDFDDGHKKTRLFDRRGSGRGHFCERPLQDSIVFQKEKDAAYNCSVLDLFELGSNAYPFYLINIRLPINEEQCEKDPNGPNCAIGRIKDLSIIVRKRRIVTVIVPIARLGDPPERRLHQDLADNEDATDAVRFGGDRLVLESHSTAQPATVPPRKGHLRAGSQPGVARL